MRRGRNPPHLKGNLLYYVTGKWEEMGEESSPGQRKPSVLPLTCSPDTVISQGFQICPVLHLFCPFSSTSPSSSSSTLVTMNWGMSKAKLSLWPGNEVLKALVDQVTGSPQGRGGTGCVRVRVVLGRHASSRVCVCARFKRKSKGTNASKEVNLPHWLWEDYSPWLIVASSSSG